MRWLRTNVHQIKQYFRLFTSSSDVYNEAIMPFIANMAEENEKKVFFKVIILCLLWYTTSSSNNIVGKTLLNEFPYPMSVTMAQLIAITFFSGPVLQYFRVKPRKKDIPWDYFRKFIIPLAFGKFLATLFSHVSLWRVPVSYAHTVKATMPLFTVAVTRILFGEKQTTKVYLSLIPIIIGVGIASITEISFDMFGLLSALTSTLGFSLLTIFSKKVLTDTGMHHLRLLHLLGKLALALFTPFWLFSDIQSLVTDKTWLMRRDPFLTFALLFLDGMLNWIQNLIAFSILNLVTPLTYAVANAAKRISVIIVSLVILGNPVTSTNVFGMCLAILGVFGYNKSKYDAVQERKRALSVPLSKVTSAVTTQYPIQNFSDLKSEKLSRYFPNPLQTAPFAPMPTELDEDDEKEKSRNEKASKISAV